MILIKKLLTFLILFFTFNLLHIDSNSQKRLIYDKNNIYDYGYHTLYFINTNTNELNNIINNFNIDILSYTINNKKYYSRNIDELENEILNSLTINEKSYYYYNGIKIDSINVLCTTSELIKLEKAIDIY